MSKEKEESEREESAVDEIYKISKDSDLIVQYLKLIDTNMKILLNKMNKIDKALEGRKEPTPIPIITATPGTPPPSASKKEASGLVIGRVKVFGYIANRSNDPIYGVEVNIFDDENQIIKKRKTDKEGYWEVRLPGGEYSVEYIQKGYKPINRSIALGKTMASYEVK